MQNQDILINRTLLLVPRCLIHRFYCKWLTCRSLKLKIAKHPIHGSVKIKVLQYSPNVWYVSSVHRKILVGKIFGEQATVSTYAKYNFGVSVNIGEVNSSHSAKFANFFLYQNFPVYSIYMQL